MTAVEPTTTGFPWTDSAPSWLTWTAPDNSWEVSYGDDGDGFLTAPSGAQVITVSAGKHAGPRWFEVADPRGLADALIAAADRAETAQAASETPAGASGGETLAPAGHHDWLAAEMHRQHTAGLPLLDNVGGGAVDYDGPRCDECGTPVTDDAPAELCDDCRQVDEEPHPYVCPTCSGNGCRVCAGSGELVEWSR